MEIIINETQNRILIENNIKDQIKNSYKEVQRFIQRIGQETFEQYSKSLKFLFTYGAGIGAIMNHILDKVQGLTSTLNLEQQVSVVIASVFTVYFNYNFFEKIKKGENTEELKKAYIESVKEAEKLKNKWYKFLKILGLSVHGITDIIAYTYLLPALNVLINILTKGGYNSEEIDIFFKTIPYTFIYNFSGLSVKSFMDALAEKIYEKRSKKNVQNPDLLDTV